MSVKLAHFRLELTCVCGHEMKGSEVVLRRAGTAPVVCPNCGETFTITFLKEPPPRIEINPLDRDNPVRIGRRPKGQTS